MKPVDRRTLGGFIQIRPVAASAVLGLLCACVPQSDLEKANTQIANLQAENTLLKADVTKLKSGLAKKKRCR